MCSPHRRRASQGAWTARCGGTVGTTSNVLVRGGSQIIRKELGSGPPQYALTGWTHVGEGKVSISGTDECGKVVDGRLPAGSMTFSLGLGYPYHCMQARYLNGEGRLDRKDPHLLQVFGVETLGVHRLRERQDPNWRTSGCEKWYDQ